MKFPLQKEIEKDLTESATLLSQANNNGNVTAQDVAKKYFDAITRINQICADRNRY